MTLRMVSDDERREVAERLRGIKTTREGCGHDLCCDLWEAVYDSDYKCDEMCDECETAVLDRLADLIDPDCEEGRYSVARTARPVDRDALLALADELDGLGLTGFSSGWSSCAVNVGSFARRIREACGMVDAG